MSIATVIAALVARLGPPEHTGEFKGNPTASWGRTRYPGPGVDCYVHADGSAHIDVWRLPRIGVGGVVRTFVIEEHSHGVGEIFRPSCVPRFATLAEADAYTGSLGTCIAPLDVAVEVAARAMPVPLTDAERERLREQGRVAARNIAANVYREADNTHAAQMLYFEAWAVGEYGAERGAPAVVAFREGLYGDSTKGAA